MRNRNFKLINGNKKENDEKLNEKLDTLTEIKNQVLHMDEFFSSLIQEQDKYLGIKQLERKLKKASIDLKNVLKILKHIDKQPFHYLPTKTHVDVIRDMHSM